ncbi:TPA: helix-turn-helix transcriptional regulator [Streptococcus suis]|uniref:Helix-turn-helix transcriptional regulator n=3 Tax=Streptococcus suis TaxID=1307 RepID=A0A0Z8G371_STRSU|nr:helix-turn-helix transcriptional regulator [Streptococcus suis]MCQ8271042.1 helix-turn-helix domain-containing protein [Streptococcus suis]MCQ8785215.1 helix-turn-helix domain-containing protein [Streptococcus suis]MDW8719593.1 helix-turn-helix transcriptional regulator [Streptococcus suis]MDY7596514.1 helix-turn-helix transcriptional regulator [Streptococcus suis]MDY7601036.1 helix-turn-helix transcriptional regulator [Streptococcus suis]
MNRLKELRKEKSLSQVAFSKEIGIPLRTLQSWENGESQIKPDKAQALAEHFGVSVGYLLGYEDLLDQLEEVDAELAKGMALSKNLSMAASSSYDELFENILELLKKLKEVAEVTQVDSNTLIEVIKTLEDHLEDLDDSMKKIMTAQIKYIELQNLKRKLNKYKD